MKERFRSFRVRGRGGLRRSGRRAAADGTSCEKRTSSVDLARRPDAAGQLQDVRRARRQAHRRAGEDRGARGGQIVPPFEILDATHKRVIDGGHGVAYYWVARTRRRRCSRDAGRPVSAMDHSDFLGWMNEGGGMDLYWSSTGDILKLNVVAWPIGARVRRRSAGSQAADQELADFKGMKCRQTGIVAEIYQRMGMQTFKCRRARSCPRPSAA